MNKLRLCDSNCDWLFPKEHDQSKKKEGHLCQRYNKVLKHLGYHPNLVACEECLYNSYAI
jgi:hypothetical protein